MDKSLNCIIRPLRSDETFLLKDFLYEAIFVPGGVEPPSREVIDLPELRVYVKGFGEKKDDHCLVAECGGKVVGAVWCRIMNDYGHVDDDTLSLSISLFKEYRNKGIGSVLMSAMIDLLKEKGYGRVSLSVQKANYAAGMYLKLGFVIVNETEEEYVMVKKMTDDSSNYERFLSGGNNNCVCGGRLNTDYKLRKLEEKDVYEMQELFRSTVLNVNLGDYTEEETADWASCGDSVERFKELVSQNCFVGAFNEEGCLVGYSSMNAGGYLHSMFVHKDWQGRGVATRLLAEVEDIAGRYGVGEITSEVSITARPFFERKGYELVTAQKRKANKLELTNFVMRKFLVKRH